MKFVLYFYLLFVFGVDFLFVEELHLIQSNNMRSFSHYIIETHALSQDKFKS